MDRRLLSAAAISFLFLFGIVTTQDPATTTTTTTTTTVAAGSTTTTSTSTTTTVTTTTTEAPLTLEDGICYCLGATSAGNIASRPAAEREKMVRKLSELRREQNQLFTVGFQSQHWLSGKVRRV